MLSLSQVESWKSCAGFKSNIVLRCVSLIYFWEEKRFKWSYPQCSRPISLMDLYFPPKKCETVWKYSDSLAWQVCPCCYEWMNEQMSQCWQTPVGCDERQTVWTGDLILTEEKYFVIYNNYNQRRTFGLRWVKIKERSQAKLRPTQTHSSFILAS